MFSGDPKAHPRWMPDELQMAGRENVDASHVARYDAKEDAQPHEEVAVCRRLGLTEDSVVVEFGAGTGQFTVAVASVCARVIAVDVSPLMRAALVDNVRATGATNVEVIAAGFLSYRHTGPPADFVYSRYALHHLPDFWKAVALERLRRMMRPGGVCRLWDIVFSFELGDADACLEAWCDTAPDVGSPDEWTRADLEEHVRDEHSTFSWLLMPMFERAGFRVEEAVYGDDRMSAKYVLRAV